MDQHTRIPARPQLVQAQFKNLVRSSILPTIEDRTVQTVRKSARIKYQHELLLNAKVRALHTVDMEDQLEDTTVKICDRCSYQTMESNGADGVQVWLAKNVRLSLPRFFGLPPWDQLLKNHL